MTRPSWNERMVLLAEHWAQWSTCLRRQVGAVVFHPTTKAVLGLGYNDTAIGAVDCGAGGCERCGGESSATEFLDCDCVHAEMNAILLAGTSLRGAVMAVASLKDGVRSPKEICRSCRKHARQAGIQQFIYFSEFGWVKEEST